MNNFQAQQRLNTINMLFPDYSIDTYGMGVGFDPSYINQIQNNDDALAINITGDKTGSNYYPQETDESLKEGRYGGWFEDDEEDDEEF